MNLPAWVYLVLVFVLGVGVAYLAGCRAGHTAGVAEQRDEAEKAGAGRWATHHKTGERVFEYRSPEEARREKERKLP
jgi:hypothetical protein